MFLAFALSLATATNPLLQPDAPNPCDSCAEWNQPHEAVHIFGNTWWVGVAGISAMAIKTSAGVILLDGALPQSAPHVLENLKTAGLRIEDVKLIGNTHAHYDHAGGIAALQRASGARIIASAWSAEVLRSGCPKSDDPQFGFGCETNGFPPVSSEAPLHLITDGQVITLGDVSITAHFTPGHTPGGTTWSWKSCEGKRCLNIVYGDSLTPVSHDSFRFEPLAKSFAATIAKVRALRCDVLVTAHPDLETLGKPPKGAPCAAYADGAKAKLEKRLATERAQPDAGRK